MEILIWILGILCILHLVIAVFSRQSSMYMAGMITHKNTEMHTEKKYYFHTMYKIKGKENTKKVKVTCMAYNNHEIGDYITIIKQ